MATPTPERSAGAFPATHWSVVFTAGHGGSTDADAALADLCRTYWYPLYAFARREGHAPEDAQPAFLTRNAGYWQDRPGNQHAKAASLLP